MIAFRDTAIRCLILAAMCLPVCSCKDEDKEILFRDINTLDAQLSAGLNVLALNESYTKILADTLVIKRSGGTIKDEIQLLLADLPLAESAWKTLNECQGSGRYYLTDQCIATVKPTLDHFGVDASEREKDKIVTIILTALGGRIDGAASAARRS